MPPKSYKKTKTTFLHWGPLWLHQVTKGNRNSYCFFFLFLWRNYTILIQKCTIWFFRRKYELQQFMECDDGLTCPIVPSQGRCLTLAQSSSSCYNSHMEKKQYDKAPTRHRIGHAFRNSWGRKDSEHKHPEHKHPKKSTSLVMFHLIKASSISYLSNELNHSFWSQLMQQQICYIVN